MTMKLARVAAIFSIAFGWQASAQNFDNSGNGLLKGTYYFREAVWIVGDQSGNLEHAGSVYGNIVFDGNGNYSLSGANLAVDGGAPTAYAQSGTYTISASGYGYISSPAFMGDSIYGLVSQGIFIGSATENHNAYNNLFIAAPVSSPAATLSTLKGAYTVFDLDNPSGAGLDARDSQLAFSADGAGGIGTITVTGYVGISGNTAVRQTLSGVRYSFSNGAGVISLGGQISDTRLVAGTYYLYPSPDGSFVFGGSPNGWDMMIGLRSTAGSAPVFSGLYYQAGMDLDNSNLGSGYSSPDSFFGSIKAIPGLTILGHQRFLSAVSDSAYDYTFSDKYPTLSGGSYDDANTHYIFNSTGTIRVGIGISPYLGVNVALQAPAFSAPGVYIDPTGITNSGSTALFTAGIAPGELITIYGSGLSPRTLSDPFMPFTLGGVQVTINGRPAPIYVVSSGFVTVMVPYATTELIAAIQVTNNGTPSNTVTVFSSLTQPGIFTKNPVGGFGYAAARHSTADAAEVTPSNPAKIGETIALYLTGIGAVDPAVADGAPGVFTTATNSISVFFNGVQAAAPSYVGLTPTAIGLAQINVTVPAGISTGDVYVEISGPDSFTSEAVMTIAPAGSSTTGVSPAISLGTAPRQQRVPPNRREHRLGASRSLVR
jgi:uncharacterized protein (TIGR03437 family)